MPQSSIYSEDKSKLLRPQKSSFPLRGSLFKIAIRRIIFWYKLVRACRGLDKGSILNLYTSAFFDVQGLFVNKKLTNPTFRKSGFYQIRPFGFKVFARGGTEDLYYASPKRERIVTNFVRANLKKGDIFVDVGANIGYYALLGSLLVGATGTVIAVEPVPETVKVLRLNLKLNNARNIKVIDKAAWNKKEKLLIEMPQGFFGLASGVINYTEAKSMFQVAGVPMDEVLEPYSLVKIIKIDVEGAELYVLRGLRKTLPKTANVVLEASTEREKIVEMLTSFGFTCQRVGVTDYLICSNKSLN
ncbi:FkbM family methyltransferase [Candidatus Bathyarchaeota archaeon]|nr:FkbM family methyltransferase [Candidatus Bathyarchaeota archaeon]